MNNLAGELWNKCEFKSNKRRKFSWGNPAEIVQGLHPQKKFMKIESKKAK